MFHILTRTLSLRNQSWLYVKFMSATSLSSKGNSFTVSYLIDTCGFSPERAASVSKRINFETSEKPDLVIQFFENHGLSQSQALRLIRKFPQLLRTDPEKYLKPKIDFFKSKGFSSSDILRLIMGCPFILARSLQNEIIPCFNFFDNMFQSKQKLMKVIMHHSGILCDLDRCSAPNIKLLREEGVPESHIVKFVQYFPLALKATPKQFKEAVQEVKEMKFDPLKLQFVLVVHKKIQISKSTWARKERIYRKWGWTDDDIAATRVYPWCMSISDNKIEAIMDFLVNRLGYKSSDIARCPAVLSLSLGKRIIPRGSVIQVLLSKGLVIKPSLNAIFKCVEQVFLDRFIYCHEKEADKLLKLYRARLA